MSAEQSVTDEKLREAVMWLRVEAGDCFVQNTDEDIELSSGPCMEAALDIIETALAELAALRAERVWQPIETAPRDGSNILAFVPYGEGSIMQTYWLVDERDGVWYDESGEICPTHWMPLPPPPAEGGV